MNNTAPVANHGSFQHAQEIQQGERFEFGKNWARFLSLLDEERIADAEASLQTLFEVADFKGKTFLDIGSGSGLFSLAARRLGAQVVSFDYDPQSVACTQALKDRFYANDPLWAIEQGSVLDLQYMNNFGQFDFVYSWGVLHHTGSMWRALENAHLTVRQGGKLCIALYNYQPFASIYWTWVKKIYNRHKLMRPILIGVHFIYPTIPSILLKAVQRRKYPRGMSPWYDLFDWLGGYPFEVSKPEEVFNFYKKLGYRLTILKTVGGRLGCNEYVFERETPHNP